MLGQVREVHERAVVKKESDKDGRKGAWPQGIGLGHVGRIYGQLVGSRAGVVYSVAESGPLVSLKTWAERAKSHHTPPQPQPALCPGTSPFTTYVERPSQLSRLLSLVCHPHPGSSSILYPPSTHQASPGCLELRGQRGPGSPCMWVGFLLGDRAVRVEQHPSV